MHFINLRERLTTSNILSKNYDIFRCFRSKKYIELRRISNNKESLLRNEDITYLNHRVEKSCLRIYLERYTAFFRSPKVHFVYESLFYLIFLNLFTYTMLCKYNYYDMTDYNSNSSNKTSTSEMEKPLSNPSILEYLLIIWVGSFILDEIYQVLLIEKP